MEKREERLRQEFNAWAMDARGAGLEDGHIDVTRQIIEMMPLQPQSYVLDLGCGMGWATRLLATRVTQGHAIGIDISDQMIAQAKAVNPPPNVDFQVASASTLPFSDNYFDYVLSVESLYYYPDLLVALKEVVRVLKPQGQFYAMVNLYQENTASHHWVEKLAVPVHLLSAPEYCELFCEAGFEKVSDLRVYDQRELLSLTQTTGFDTPQRAQTGQLAGSLVITGSKTPAFT